MIFVAPREKKSDPIASYKRMVQRTARGKSEKERLDFYIHLLEQEVRPEYNEATAKFKYLNGRTRALLARLGYLWNPFLTEDKLLQAGFEPYLTLEGKTDARRFKRFVKEALGSEAAKEAVTTSVKYQPNPEVLRRLGDENKRVFCARYGKRRCKVRAATSKTLQG